MAIEIRADRVYAPTTPDVSVSAVRATSTLVARVPGLTTPPVVTPVQFDVLQEYFGDGSTLATQETADLGINSAGFRAALSGAEVTYVNNNHRTFCYICLPHDLISPAADPDLLSSYPDSTDVNYRTTMTNFTNTWGSNVYLFACPEWDNDPGNNGWATNRFSELTGIFEPGRGDIPTGLTRQQAYDQYIHFYTANHHGGITNHHQLGQLLGVSAAARGYKIMSNNVNAGSCFYGFEMGMDRISLQRNNDDIGGLVGSVGFIRGAATQYGKAWGWDTSHSRTYSSLVGVTTYNSSQVLTSGWSAATYKRHYYVCWMSGAHVLMEEAADHRTNGNTNINGRLYTPFGTTLRDFTNCALVRHPDRGVPHVPIAIMKEHISFLEPRFGQFNQGRNVWWQNITANAGDNMLHNLLDLLYPNYATWGSDTTTTEYWGSGRWGEQFDILTERASASVMGLYRVVMLSTNIASMDATLQAKLTTFVTNGGILVVNAKQLTGTAHQSFTGVTITGTASTSGTLTWELDGTTVSEPTFNYSTVTLGTATRIARIGAGNIPMVTRNLVGSGEVWTVLPDYMSNPANTATLGLATKVIGHLITQFQVGSISGGNHTNIDYLVTKQAGTGGTTNTVTVINASGTTWTGTVSLPQGTPVREWIADVTPTSSNAAGRTNITASVPGNDVKVYAVG